MSQEHELPSDSDEDDEDYVPDGAEEAVSEAESEGEAESGPEDENNENEQLTTKKVGRKRGKTSKKGSKRRKNASTEEDLGEKEKKTETEELSEEEQKKKADSLWADFMKDTGTIPKSKSQNSSNTPQPPVVRQKPEDKVKITKIYEFAGEEVKIEKEVSADSAEARLSLLNSEKPKKHSAPEPVPRASGRGGGSGRGGLGGISSVLGQIGKKAKISTLEKSKLDWDTFKKQENLDEEITTHNKGRDGFLERQDFLQRADLRQFEIEKQLRTTARRSNR